MRLEELMTLYERRAAEAREHGSTAPLERVYALVLEDLRRLDGVGSPDRVMDTAEAASALGVRPKTVRSWCGEGRFAGARRTSGKTGEWRIPAAEVIREAGAVVPPRTSSPRLWTPKGGD
jgi:hypothetical protein